MDYKFTKEIIVPYFAVNADTHIRIPSLTAFLQDMAIEHSNSAGYTIKKLMDMKKGWVITNWHIIIDSLPKLGDKVTLKTWSSKFRRFQADRGYTVENEKGFISVRAMTRWVFMDLESRSPSNVPESMPEDYKTGASACIENEKYRMSKIDDAEFLYDYEFCVMRGQTDTNGHTNNTQYIEWAIDMVPDDIYNNLACKDLKVAYRKESRRGDKIIAKTYKKLVDNGVDIITVMTNHDNVALCQTESLWA